MFNFVYLEFSADDDDDEEEDNADHACGPQAAIHGVTWLFHLLLF